MQLIVFTGLPGAGKSLLAEAVGRELKIPVFAKDWLEATLLRSGLQDTEKVKLGYVGYELLTVLAQRQLSLGQSVILDSVAGLETIRKQWRDMAACYDAEWRVMECVCSSEEAHRERLASRRRGIPGWHELTWADVERVSSYYEQWREAHLTLDTTQPLFENLQKVRVYLSK
jgi:predicted kinase